MVDQSPYARFGDYPLGPQFAAASRRLDELGRERADAARALDLAGFPVPDGWALAEVVRELAVDRDRWRAAADDSADRSDPDGGSGGVDEQVVDRVVDRVLARLDNVARLTEALTRPGEQQPAELTYTDADRRESLAIAVEQFDAAAESWPEYKLADYIDRALAEPGHITVTDPDHAPRVPAAAQAEALHVICPVCRERLAPPRLEVDHANSTPIG